MVMQTSENIGISRAESLAYNLNWLKSKYIDSSSPALDGVKKIAIGYVKKGKDGGKAETKANEIYSELLTNSRFKKKEEILLVIEEIADQFKTPQIPKDLTPQVKRYKRLSEALSKNAQESVKKFDWLRIEGALCLPQVSHSIKNYLLIYTEQNQHTKSTAELIYSNIIDDLSFQNKNLLLLLDKLATQLESPLIPGSMQTTKERYQSLSQALIKTTKENFQDYDWLSISHLNSPSHRENTLENIKSVLRSYEDPSIGLNPQEAVLLLYQGLYDNEPIRKSIKYILQDISEEINQIPKRFQNKKYTHLSKSALEFSRKINTKGDVTDISIKSQIGDTQPLAKPKKAGSLRYQDQSEEDFLSTTKTLGSGPTLQDHYSHIRQLVITNTSISKVALPKKATAQIITYSEILNGNQFEDLLNRLIDDTSVCFNTLSAHYLRSAYYEKYKERKVTSKRVLKFQQDNSSQKTPPKSQDALYEPTPWPKKKKGKKVRIRSSLKKATYHNQIIAMYGQFKKGAGNMEGLITRIAKVFENASLDCLIQSLKYTQDHNESFRKDTQIYSKIIQAYKINHGQVPTKSSKQEPEYDALSSTNPPKRKRKSPPKSYKPTPSKNRTQNPKAIRPQTRNLPVLSVSTIAAENSPVRNFEKKRDGSLGMKESKTQNPKPRSFVHKPKKKPSKPNSQTQKPLRTHNPKPKTHTSRPSSKGKRIPKYIPKQKIIPYSQSSKIRAYLITIGYDRSIKKKPYQMSIIVGDIYQRLHHKYGNSLSKKLEALSVYHSQKFKFFKSKSKIVKDLETTINAYLVNAIEPANYKRIKKAAYLKPKQPNTGQRNDSMDGLRKQSKKERKKNKPY